MGQNGMDGDSENSESEVLDGGTNRTDPIPGLGGKTRDQLKLETGQVTLENMDADLFNAVKQGDEATIRARLGGGDRKMSEAEAAILVKTREAEELHAYEAKQAADATATNHGSSSAPDILAPVHDYLYWSRAFYWAQQAQIQQSDRPDEGVPSHAPGLSEDGYVYDNYGGRYDQFGSYQFKDGSVKTANGDFFNAKDNTYHLANGDTGQTISPELQEEAKKAGISIADTNAALAAKAQARANYRNGIKSMPADPLHSKGTPPDEGVGGSRPSTAQYNAPIKAEDIVWANSELTNELQTGSYKYDPMLNVLRSHQSTQTAPSFSPTVTTSQLTRPTVTHNDNGVYTIKIDTANAAGGSHFLPSTQPDQKPAKNASHFIGSTTKPPVTSADSKFSAPSSDDLSSAQAALGAELGDSPATSTGTKTASDTPAAPGASADDIAAAQAALRASLGAPLNSPRVPTPAKGPSV